MRHLDLFSGIGGFALAAEMVWPEAEHIFCDIEPFSQAVLRKHWPDAKIYGDIRTLHGNENGAIDLLTGGFPCQPFSSAGKRKGTEDDRHLWPEMLRVIREATPRWIIGENVSGLLTWDGGMVLDSVLSDLEGSGYDAWPLVIPAAAVDAPHRRDRVWIIAHSTRRRLEGRDVSIRLRRSLETATDTNGIREDVSDTQLIGRQARELKASGRPASERRTTPDQPRRRGSALAHSDSIDVEGSDAEATQGRQGPRRSARLRGGTGGGPAKWPAEPSVGRVAHGVPSRVDRIKALGNAIVPQVAAQIMRAIKEADV